MGEYAIDSELDVAGEQPRGRGRPRLSEVQAKKIRDRIATVARALFIEEGYDGVSIRKIAKKVPCSTGVLYHQFANKRAILQDIWDDIYLACFKYCDKAASRESGPIEKLREFFVAYLEYWGKYPSHFKMIYLLDEREDQDAYWASHSKAFTQFDNWILPLIAEGVERGVLSVEEGISDTDVVLALYNICQGLSYRRVSQPKGNDQEEKKFNEFAINTILKGFSGPNA